MFIAICCKMLLWMVLEQLHSLHTEPAVCEMQNSEELEKKKSQMNSHNECKSSMFRHAILSADAAFVLVRSQQEPVDDHLL